MTNKEPQRLIIVENHNSVNSSLERKNGQDNSISSKDGSIDTIQDNPPIDKKLGDSLRDFSDSLVEVLNDITALEVNTMIVSEITGTKFIPEEAYQNIYFCLHKSKIPNKLRKNLQIELAKMAVIKDIVDEKRIPPDFLNNDYKDNENIEFTDVSSKIADEVWRLREKLTKEYIQIFFKEVYNSKKSHMDLPSNLPFPYVIKEQNPDFLRLNKDVIHVLADKRFLRSLRKISELQAGINNGDTIYAQTVLQLDGDVINRYREDLFKNPDKQLIIDIHNKGVVGAETQWRGLLKSTVDLVKNIMTWLGNVHIQDK